MEPKIIAGRQRREPSRPDQARMLGMLDGNMGTGLCYLGRIVQVKPSLGERAVGAGIPGVMRRNTVLVRATPTVVHPAALE